MTTKDSVNVDRIMAGLNEAVDIAEGRAKPARVYVPVDVDVKAVRKRAGLTQEAFAARYGFSVSAVRDWEQKRRKPEASARVLLRVIERRPDAVEEALGVA